MNCGKIVGASSKQGRAGSLRSPAWRAAAALALIAVALSILTAAPARADDWESYQHDPANTGYTASSPNPALLTLKWQAPDGFETPFIVGSNVIATDNAEGGGGDSVVKSFQMANGAVNWSYSLPAVFGSQAAYGNGLVTVTNGSGTMEVLNATTGAREYSVNLGFDGISLPLMVAGSNGTTIAYLENNGTFAAVSLGSSSGSILWKQTNVNNEGGGILPSVISGGNTVLWGGDNGDYYSFNATTGAIHQFGPASNGYGSSGAIVYDANEKQVYVEGCYNAGTNELTAYSFGGSYTSLTKVWQTSAAGISGNGYSQASVCLDANGDIYSADSSTLVEINPTNGAVLRSVTGEFADNSTPMVTGNTVWVDGANDQTFGYNIANFSLVAALPFSRGDDSTPFDSSGAADANDLILTDAPNNNPPGFQAYIAPEPDRLVFVLLPLIFLTRPKRRASFGVG